MSSPKARRQRHLLVGLQAAQAARARLPEALRQWLEAEQREVHRRVDRRLIDQGEGDEVPAEFLPEAGNTFVLESAWVPASEVEVFSSSPAVRLVRTHRGERQVLMLWHPLAWPLIRPVVRGRDPGPRFFAAATASVRTMLLWPVARGVAPFFAKLALPRLLAGANRGLGAHDARTSTQATRLMDALGSQRALRFTMLREPFAVVPVAAPTCGSIVREVPKGRWLPWFAFRDHRLVEPLLARWAEQAVNAGAAAEVHSQNLLVGVDRSGQPTGRLALRDLDGVTVDLPYVGRAFPALAPLTARLVQARSAVGDEPWEGLRASVSHLVGGAAYSLGAQVRMKDALARWLDGQPVVEAVEARRARRLRLPRVPVTTRTFLEREQGLNDQVRDPRFFAQVNHDAVPTRFLASAGERWPVDAIEVPVDEVSVFGRSMPVTLRRAMFVRRNGRSFVRLFVHPMMRDRLGMLIAKYGLRSTPWTASATSSPRSLVLWNARGEAFGLKVSLDVELLGLSRLIEEGKLRRAVAVDACLKSLPQDLGVTIMREPVSVLFHELGFGQIGRVIPPAANRAVPGFGLLAEGGVLDRVPRGELLSRLEQWVFAPLARVAAQLMFQHGLLGQLHQQNVCFGLDARGVPDGTLVLRDLDSFSVDVAMRALRGRTLAPLGPSGGTPAQLKTLDAEAGYDPAWAHSIRADFGFLAERLARRRGVEGTREGVWGALDRAFLRQAQRHLGVEVVRDELAWVLKRRRGAGDAQPHVEAPSTLWSAPDDRKTALYSVNAMVHAFKARARSGSARRHR